MITGTSGLEYTDINEYFLQSGVEQAVRGKLLKDITLTEEQSKAQLICNINDSLDIKAEGYILEISKKRITITGKDDAGLFYGFMTLEQLMEDAMEQEVNLPLCKIRDYPSLAYRAIHLDIKHHREKLEYYYSLMDRLAGYKVNAIIAEVEDKIKYRRQPEVGSTDALSIWEWQELSEYANERNTDQTYQLKAYIHVVCIYIYYKCIYINIYLCQIHHVFFYMHINSQKNTYYFVK